MWLRLLREIPKARLKKKRILLRVDFNVPFHGKRVTDEYRLRLTLPTFRYLLTAGAKILILTHRGHFGIQRTPALSTRLLIPELERLLKQRVRFLKDFQALQKFSSGDERIYLFENVRFWKGEESNDRAFAQRFARAGDLYVGENFASLHRPHATIAALPTLLPSYAGFLLEKEVKSLERIVHNPNRPVVAILGGVKLETRLPLIRKFLRRGITVLVGGALMNEKLPPHPLLHLPVDGIRRNGRWLDVGPRTLAEFTATLRRARTIFWNGPLGVIEKAAYTKSTLRLARFLQHVSAFTVVGGGDTVGFLQSRNLLKGFNHVSTGGGAMLEFLAGKKLPGIEVLKK